MKLYLPCFSLILLISMNACGTQDYDTANLAQKNAAATIPPSPIPGIPPTPTPVPTDSSGQSSANPAVASNQKSKGVKFNVFADGTIAQEEVIQNYDVLRESSRNRIIATSAIIGAGSVFVAGYLFNHELEKSFKGLWKHLVKSSFTGGVCGLALGALAASGLPNQVLTPAPTFKHLQSPPIVVIISDQSKTPARSLEVDHLK
ncbi:MAG: hypothetical protein JWQ35_2127 [Bacteriovoracaceae bacterium]|nr:hypothetical protein [Bacteriovoracaceae bacterium]